MLKLSNFATTTLAASLASDGLSLSVLSSVGFPSLGASDWFYATLASSDESAHEVVKVTAISGTTWTVARAQDGTTARVWASGSVIELRLTALVLSDLLAAYCSSTDSRLSDARPASDVSAWAKAATKPSYSFGEIGSGPIAATTLSLNTPGDSSPALFSTFKGANSTGGNIWIGGGGQSSVGDSGNATLGSFNTSVGLDALSFNTQGYNNSAFGLNALQKNTTGHDNIAFGNNAGFSNTTGSCNTYSGARAGQTNQTGNNNAGSGYYSLYYNTASSNTALGAYSCYKNTTGPNNVGVGFNALYSNTAGQNNAAFGSQALSDLNITAASSGNNTAVGYNTGRGIVTGINNTILGANVTGLGAALSNNVILADGSGTIRAQHDGANWSFNGVVAAASGFSGPGTGLTGTASGLSVNYASTAGSAPASDVYSWAKASTKPSYTYLEIGPGPIQASTGTFTGAVYAQTITAMGLGAAGGFITKDSNGTAYRLCVVSGVLCLRLV